MHKSFTIAVEPSIETNDHQARLLVDGRDWLGPEFAGLDPPMLEAELLGKGVGALVLGRCRCGVPGCNDLKVEVKRTERSVEWWAPGAALLRFNPAKYDAEVARFARDKAWETPGRTVEREVDRLFRGTTIRGGLEFQWASTRIQEGFVRLSFGKGQRQKFLKFRWDGARVADALNEAKLFRAERFSHCDQAHSPGGPDDRKSGSRQ